MKPQTIRKLEQLEARYSELEGQLARPEVLADRDTYNGYAKELSDISLAVSSWKNYKKIQEEMEGLSHVLSEKHDGELVEMVRQERSALEQKQKEIEGRIEELLTIKESGCERDIIVEVRAGTGGQEASLFAADLYRMYTKFAAKCGLAVENMSSSPTELGGFKEVVFAVKGREAFSKFKFESGVHRVQRVPATEASGRIHTSAATVAVIVEPEEREFKIDQKDLKIDVFRASGHGGQSVNTADSAVRITHLPSGLVVTCQDERSQLKNKNKAMRVLRARLLDKAQQEQQSRLSRERKMQVGTGDRSEKIRTYNFPDRRVTDHRINFTTHQFEGVMDGNLDEMIEALYKAEKELKEKQ